MDFRNGSQLLKKHGELQMEQNPSLGLSGCPHGTKSPRAGLSLNWVITILVHYRCFIKNFKTELSWAILIWTVLIMDWRDGRGNMIGLEEAPKAPAHSTVFLPCRSSGQ